MAEFISFCLRIDRGYSLEVCGRLCEVRDQAPAHQDQFTLTRLPGVADDRLERGGSHVVISIGQHEAARQLAKMEGLGDALFVRTAVVAFADVRALSGR